MSDPEPTKLCGICKSHKPLSEFSKNIRSKDGRFSWCKKCVSNRNRQPEIKHAREKKNRAWRLTPRAKAITKLAARKWERANRKRARCRTSESRRNKQNQYMREYRKRNVGKSQARAAVSDAVRRRILPRVGALTCRCGNRASNYHHHKGYDKVYWLDVIPLCRLCHAKEHPKETDEELARKAGKPIR